MHRHSSRHPAASTPIRALAAGELAATVGGAAAGDGAKTDPFMDLVIGTNGTVLIGSKKL